MKIKFIFNLFILCFLSNACLFSQEINLSTDVNQDKEQKLDEATAQLLLETFQINPENLSHEQLLSLSNYLKNNPIDTTDLDFTSLDNNLKNMLSHTFIANSSYIKKAGEGVGAIIDLFCFDRQEPTKVTVTKYFDAHFKIFIEHKNEINRLFSCPYGDKENIRDYFIAAMSEDENALSQFTIINLRNNISISLEALKLSSDAFKISVDLKYLILFRVVEAEKCPYLIYDLENLMKIEELIKSKEKKERSKFAKIVTALGIMRRNNKLKRLHLQS